MTTIGYGDFYPRTIPGRLVTFILSIWGVIMVSLSVVALSSVVNVRKREQMSFHMMKEVAISNRMKDKSIDLVQSLYKSAQVYKQQDGGLFKRISLGQKVRGFRGHMRDFKRLRKEKEKIALLKDISDVIIFQNDYMKYDCTDIKENQLGILEGANKLLDKIMALRSEEDHKPSGGGFMLKLYRMKNYEEDVVQDDFWDLKDREGDGELYKPDTPKIKKRERRVEGPVEKASSFSKPRKKVKSKEKGRKKEGKPILINAGKLNMRKAKMKRTGKKGKKRKGLSSKKGFSKI